MIKKFPIFFVVIILIFTRISVGDTDKEKKKTEFPWLYDISKCVPQEALRDLDKAYKNFYISKSVFFLLSSCFFQ